jgi:hypothetical protein
MIQPEILKSNETLLWSTGRGSDVWELFCACSAGDFETVKRLVAGDPSLARSQHAYRTPLYFAVRENQAEIALFLLEHGADLFGLALSDSLLDICRDRRYRELEQLLGDRFAKLLNASAKGETVAAAILGDQIRPKADGRASPATWGLAELVGRSDLGHAVGCTGLERQSK